jgi:hypothetical protein
MNKMIIPLLGGLGLVCVCPSPVKAQKLEFSQHQTREFALPNATGGVLALYNLEGFVHVEGYAGQKVVIDLDEVISADDSATLEQGKKEVRVAFDQSADSIIVYTAEPYDTRPHRRDHWTYSDDRNEIEYRFSLSYTVKVPFGMNLIVSTVNNGDVDVQDVTGSLKVNNVNGPISIKNAKGITNARTINGNLTVSYTSAPPDGSKYYTLNGALTVTYPSDLSADLQFKSMNGRFYTDFPQIEILPVQVTKNTEPRGGGTLYKLDIDKRIRIGNGGKLFRFETMNGNIYIKKQS